jgi:hypothetical protein
VPHLYVEEGELDVRVRVSRPELSVDCSSNRFPAPVSDQVFGPWRTVALRPEPTPLFRPEERRPDAEQECVLFALDTPDGPLVLRSNPGLQSYAIQRDSTGKLSSSNGAGLTRPTDTAPVCKRQRPMSWSDAVLTGRVRIQAMLPAAADGCQTLELASADADGGPTLRLSVCIGSAKLPFAAGEAVRISNNEHQSTRTRALRIERTEGERVVLWLLRGPPSGFAAVGWDPNLASIGSALGGEDCRAELAPNCATVELGDEVRFSVTPRSLALRAGESANLAHQNGTMLELHVVHSVLRPVVDPSCSRDLDTLPADVGVVLIERGGSNAPTPQIAH